MTRRFAFWLLIFTAGVIISCEADIQSETGTGDNEEQQKRDTIELKESFNEADIAVNEYLEAELKTIRANSHT